MQLPHLVIYVTEQDVLMLSHVMQNAQEPLDVEHSLHALAARGIDEATKGIGKVVLGLMELWYPDVMRKFPNLHVPYEEREDLDLLITLFSRSVTKKTTVHFAAIDEIIGEILAEKPELATHAAIATWPELRASLARRYGPSGGPKKI